MPDPERESRYKAPALPDIQKEKLDVLDGSQTLAARPRAAVRLQDLSGILKYPPKLQSAAAAGAPTKAEYDALVRDVKAMHDALVIVANAINARLK